MSYQYNSDSDTSEEMVIRLKLIIDEEKQKVVLAEAGKDFVDILFSFLTLPMGTIVRSLKKYLKSESKAIGCFNNIYASLENMGIENFRTEARKQMLLYPKSLNQEKFQDLMLRIDDYEATNCFICPKFLKEEQCSKLYSNFNFSRCSCKSLMRKKIGIDNEGLISDGHTSFIITDDLKVESTSVGLAPNVLKDLGYTNCTNLAERIQEVNLIEVAALLESLFTSDTPLTHVFLKKSCSCGMKRIHKTLSPIRCEDRLESEADQTILLNAYVNKKDGNILYVECGEDFVDLLFTFLAMPLQSVWETAGNKSIFGCIGNLCRSFKDLRVDSGRESKCELPYYYKCQKQLLDLVSHKPPIYYRYLSSGTVYHLTEDSGKKLLYNTDKLVPMISVDSEPEGDSNTSNGSTTPSGGFVKKGLKFLVSDDLIIAPPCLTSAFRVLKDQQIPFDDVEVQVIIIRKEEALRLLEASLVTSTALSTALVVKESASTSEQENRVSKKPKIET